MTDTKSNRFLCIHGHFYQPPRENAWLETVELQESASPYHDWNDRITDECYGPNCVSRILNDKGQIVNIVNNLSQISYNFGPTLLSWMEINHPVNYQRILDSDKESLERFDGCGSAMAQVYNHIIMPLANKRDKDTQIKWGIYDFQCRFNRLPEGFWLAETAVDTETLELLAENDIKFTVLAPSQASKYRKMGNSSWTSGIDSKLPYLCRLPSGKEINLFFYDGYLSQKVAFGGLLKSGKDFANELIAAFDARRSEAQLVHIATDGETFGHHHRHGEMALSYCLDYIEKNGLAQIVNYSQYLKLEPPQHEVEIVENSSWSCIHGVERWRSDCGCKTGGEPHWNQKWRAPLRLALDVLNEKFADIYVREMKPYHVDPWKLRNEYIEIFYKRNRKRTREFIIHHFGEHISDQEITHLIRLFEMQKQGLFMFTSCGWFFNELSGIETVQVLQYACRGIQLAELVTGNSPQNTFLANLALAQSNKPEKGNGQTIYENQVLPKQLSMIQVGMHYAIYALFSDEDDFDVLNYSCKGEEVKKLRVGSYSLVMGKVRVDSRVTLMSQELKYILLHLGDHHLIGNCSTDMAEDQFSELSNQMEMCFTEGRLTEILDIIQHNFFTKQFSFHDLFKDEQLKLLETAVERSMNLVLQEYEDINVRMYGLMNQMRKNHLKVPMFFTKNLSALISIKLENLLKQGINMDLSFDELNNLAAEKMRWELLIDESRLSFLATRRLGEMAFKLEDMEAESQFDYLAKIREFIFVTNRLGVKPHLHEIQNIVFSLKSKRNLNPDWEQGWNELAGLLNLELNGFR